MATRGLEVTRSIREGIASGDYSPGSRMNESELAARLGVSRTPVRGALSVLAVEGLLEYTPNSGYRVRSFGSGDIQNVYAVRANLEGLVARQAAMNGLSDHARGTAHRIIDETAALVSMQSWSDAVRASWEKLNHEFHEVLRDAAQNEYLVQMIRRTDEIPFFGLIRFQWYDAQYMRGAHEEHIEILDAIINRQAGRAEALETEHVYRSGRRLARQWQMIEERKKPQSGATAIGM
ncbi:GntR family transcriptional regulator [Roseinatronobacter sp. NSM]|uniref:GntR family transcriptional regulator n=1 Tax=Roseinatronobacter sp. NSM TaxID=3457785 RepID=UPI0040367AEF